MNKRMRILSVLMALVFCAGLLAGCGGSASDPEIQDVVIWTSGEDYRNEAYLNGLREKFPDYNITLEYMNSSAIAAKVREEGDAAQVDIICSEEYNYLYMIEDQLAVLDGFDFSVFLDELVPENHKISPETKNGGCIILNPSVLESKNAPIPTSYQDLLDPQYKGLVSMPDPSSSGTGYMFLLSLVNAMGEEAAFDYFRQLSENVLSFTSSGSGPVNALIQGEVGVGLGMTAQAVTEINEGAPLEIVFFEEGSPFDMYGNAIMAKSASRQAVQDVFSYLSTELCKQNNEKFFPEQLYKDYIPKIEGYPVNIHYSDMSNNTPEEKDHLLSLWDLT